MIKFCKYLFSTTNTRQYRILKKMRKFNYYVKETGVSHKKDTQKLVEQMFFPQEEKISFDDDDLIVKTAEEEKLPQTVNEIFEFIKYHGNFDHYKLLAQISYCIQNQQQIKERITQKRKKLEIKLSQESKQKIQIIEDIYLTKAQILEHQIFKQLLNEFVEEYDIEEILEIRKKLWFAFDNKPLLELDSQVLQKIQERDQNPFLTLQFLQSLHKDIYSSTEQNYIQWFVEYFQQNNCNTKQDVLYNIVQQALNILENLTLASQEETEQLINILYNFLHQISLPPKLIENIINTINLQQLSGDYSAKLADILIESKYTDQLYLESVLMNIIRQQQCQPSLIIKILKHFHNEKLYFRNQQESQIVIIEGNIYQQLFQLINSSIVDQNTQKLEELMYICLSNGANPEIINVICSHLIKQVEQLPLVKQQDIIYNAIELGFQPNIQLLNDILKNSLNEWKDKDVQGFISGTSITTNGNNKYVYELVKRQVQLLWSVLQSDNQNKNFELINLSIHRLNEISKQDDGLLTLPIQTIRLMSLINQMIKKQSLIPQKIQIQSFLQKKDLKIKPEIFQHPLNNMQKIMQKQKLQFINKYQTLKFNLLINDIFYDCVYEQDEKLICFKLNYITQFIKQNLYKPIRSLQQQQSFLKGIPIIEINFYEFIDENTITRRNIRVRLILTI
ncbi:hypothetical protein pb186bvf_001181 [Paramecium bursaria]